MVIWITGLSGAGKTTLSEALFALLKPRLPELALIDGDAVQEFPTFAHAYTGLGRISLIEKKYDEALYHLTKSSHLSPNWKVYAYLIQLFVLENNTDAANQIIDQSKKFLIQKEIEILRSIYKMSIRDGATLPIDLGI